MALEQEQVSVLEQARRRTRRDSGSPTRIGLREKRERERERERERARERARESERESERERERESERGEYVCERETGGKEEVRNGGEGTAMCGDSLTHRSQARTRRMKLGRPLTDYT